MTKPMFFPTPLGPIHFPTTEKEKHEFELRCAIDVALKIAGVPSDDLPEMHDEVLKKLGRYDLLPPCERKGE